MIYMGLTHCYNGYFTDVSLTPYIILSSVLKSFSDLFVIYM